jgi:hypothetical protein
MENCFGSKLVKWTALKILYLHKCESRCGLPLHEKHGMAKGGIDFYQDLVATSSPQVPQGFTCMSSSFKNLKPKHRHTLHHHILHSHGLIELSKHYCTKDSSTISLLR